MSWADRILTIVVTATVTSAAWIVAAGTGLLPTADRAERTTARGASEAVNDDAAGATPIGGLIVPVSGVARTALSDSYQDARGSERVHEAIDIAAPRGTPVIAAAPGTIEKLFQSQDGGNTIYQRSEDRRTIYYYAHLDSYAPDIQEGRKVARGQTLGAVGSTGNASETAPHLHFAILRTVPKADWWDMGTAIDPYPVLRGR
ncbi:MAG TPA: M23 family metallopeptidase [Croceibacterium sp.]|nr:M23 family metallopeptidase [Croceibacterium sp.]